MKKKGFTLIELLVVIAIIAMVAAILVPAFTKIKNRITGKTNTKQTKQANGAQMRIPEEDIRVLAECKDDIFYCKRNVSTKIPLVSDIKSSSKMNYYVETTLEGVEVAEENGKHFIYWTPSLSQMGLHEIKVIISDGVMQTNKTVKVKVN